jgi:hypothetical protein
MRVQKPSAETACIEPGLEVYRIRRRASASGGKRGQIFHRAGRTGLINGIASQAACVGQGNGRDSGAAGAHGYVGVSRSTFCVYRK